MNNVPHRFVLSTVLTAALSAALSVQSGEENPWQHELHARMRTGSMSPIVL